MARNVVKVKRQTLEACMTCPLCHNLLRQPTTISLCLHTFCRKCIYKRFSDDAVDTCPVCEIGLGCVPVEKLRADHNLHDIRARIFPFKRRKVEPSEVVTSIAFPAKRNETSLSSLVVTTPKVPIQTGLNGIGSKAGAIETPGLWGGAVIPEESNKAEDSIEDLPISSSSPESQDKISESKRQESSFAEPSNEQQTNGSKDSNGEPVEGKADLRTPLNCFGEAANITKSSKASSPTSPEPPVAQPRQQSLPKSEPVNGLDVLPSSLETETKVEPHVVHDSGKCNLKSESKEQDHGTEVEDDNNCINPVTPPRLTTTKGRAAISEELSGSARFILDAAMNKGNRRNCSVWFSLVASDDKNGDASLPQIPACYLRIKDSKMLVSSIQKYIVKKLALSNEAEVEIMCRGQPVVPTLQLQNLVDIWFRNAATAKKVAASVGSSAKDLVMVLSYCRKVQAS